MTLDTLSLEEFEKSLPAAPQPVGSYVTAVRTGNLIMTSGALPVKEGALLYQGPVDDASIEQGQEAAQLCCMNTLSVLKDMLGSLNQIQRIVKLTGYVKAAPEFTQHPQVINGASDFLVQVLGDAKGRHARAAVGVASLPMNASVELDMVVEVAG